MLQFYSYFKSMKSVIIFIFLTSCIVKSEQDFFAIYPDFVYEDSCVEDQYVVEAFSDAFNDFTVKLYKIAAPKASYFLILSPYSVWITLAAIAESDYNTHQDLFTILNLPKDPCSRHKFYQLAATRISSQNHVKLSHTATMIIDDGSKLNPYWFNLIRHYSLLEISFAPIKRDSQTASNIIDDIIPLENRGVNLNGNSVLLNHISFNGFWTTAFDEATIVRAPFYSYTGERVGSIDLMKIRKKLRVGYVPSINAKIVELPVGINEEYSIVFALTDTDANVKSAIFGLANYTMREVISSLRDSNFPVDVAIPRIVINSDIDVKNLLLEMGIRNIWKDPWATRYISTPSAQPSSFIQRTTLTLDSYGFNPPPAPSESTSYPHKTAEERYWGEFIANRPFLFALFDTETYTCLMAALYTQPTYPD